ncbi:methyltransferase domain-containing protein [Brasilonema sp. UFV-L1]|uniref:methyltransferase domain-containing protein n=1 Tax=Brasilonema sp. UFV-L1 TaxID=2234130 RepID=UPI00145F0B32|nr:methyltransferase domain-containing protein [Brasilonema sp. UFV-L1]NMG08963.1 methyltransferase type 11 [Brasilonema sp. UFV-L1]
MNTELKTKSDTKLTENTQKLLCCPVCQSQLELVNSHLECKNSQCKASFPIISKIPILINDSSSVFSISDYLDNKISTLKPKSKLERLLINLVPGINLNLKSKTNFQKFVQLLLKENKSPRVLIIGGSVVGQGIEPLLLVPEIELIETDVAFGDRISVISDAHNIPFVDSSFDGVVVQAVLEHVVDPNRCVEEIHRVLKPNSLVYSETPFMQQVHLGKYDFTRFTHLGHRRLFRKFEEIDSGAVCGPGMALAWSYQYFLLSFVKKQLARGLVKVFARVTSFWLKYFDYYLINKPGTFDSASGYYFLGKKSEKILSDQDLITLYRGTQSSSF